MLFCPSCGKEVASYQKFCKHCGAPVELSPAPPSPLSPPPPPPLFVPPQPLQSSPLPEEQAVGIPPSIPVVATPKKSSPTKNTLAIISAIIIVVVIAGVYFVVLPKISGITGSAAQTPLATMTVSPTTPFPTATTVPTPPADPFPNALPLKKWFQFNEGKTKSEGTVYRYWINETYQWHGTGDSRSYPQKPKHGNKYLFVFAGVVNRGDTPFPYPKSSSIFVHYNGSIYTPDTEHYLPDKALNPKATAFLIEEIQSQPDLFNVEYVEDYGYSHSTTANMVYPGEGSAVDGYIIYEVPASLTPDKTYVEIVFNGHEKAVWKLA